MTPELALQGVGLALTAGVGLLFWSLKRNVSDVDKKLGRMESDLRQLSSSVHQHDTRLGQGDVELRELRTRVQGIEDRERTRGCFGSCHVKGDGG